MTSPHRDRPTLEIANLSIGVTSEKTPIVDGLSLAVRRGETLCLVGESGSGKSVTSYAVMGLLPKILRARGDGIWLEGRNLLQADARALRSVRATQMGMIFQEPMTALNPVIPVGRQIEEVLKAHGADGAGERRRRILKMLEDVHLPDVERIYGSYPHQLSGGQRQRIMIAMALILRPRLLIADEPTTALDVTTQRQILSLIRELQDRQGTSVLFITHDMGVVADIADEVAVLRSGRLVEAGAKSEVLGDPSQDYTRQLLAAVPSLVPRAPRPLAETPPVLRVSDLGKTYQERTLLGRGRTVVAATGVSFELRKGSTLGIVGESGSGKSTVARSVIRLIEPTAGSIELDGRDIAGLAGERLRQYRRDIQMIFQDPYRSLNPRLRVEEAIIEGPSNFGVQRARALDRARELLGLVGLPADAGSRYPHQFSGGQRQRIAIARALAMEPSVLVADEAVSALDVSVQAQVLELLDDLQKRLGIALLFITHDLRVAAQICDDLIVMKNGRIVEHGAASEVISRPTHAYTRELFEAAPGRAWNFGAPARVTAVGS